MMKRSLILALVLLAATTAARAALSPFESPAPLTTDNPIDKLVFGRLQQLGIQPANLCSDAVFIRRAYLDVIGTLPTVQEVNQFLSDNTPDKRRALIEKLLQRDEFADYWAMKWCDILRVKSEFPINLWPNAVQAYQRWIRTSIKENKPYDQFVRELLTSTGSNFRVAPVNFYRAIQSREPQAVAQAVALAFMGARADKWGKNRLAECAAFFSKIGYKSTEEWKEELIFFDPNKKSAGVAERAVFPDGKEAKIDPDRDPREVFADWLITPENPWFTRNIANRVWAWLLGRGIIQEPDDIRVDNPPSNPELLALLAQELINAKYDLKALYRLILNSQTYQLSSIPKTKSAEAEANFASYPLRRLDAEVLIDALNAITGTTELYSSAIPEPYTFIPEDIRSIALPDGSISSSFLEMFGRSSRDTGQETERNNKPTADQRLHMLNSSHIQKKIEQGRKLQALMTSGRQPRQIVTNLYLTILSRRPTEEELAVVGSYSRAGRTMSKEAFNDLAWALINSAEFLYRH